MTDRYNTPAKGTTNWHIPLNDNFTNLDVDVEHRDTDANLSKYTPADGAKFLATDTGTVYIGDGSSWNSLGTIGGGTGSTTFTHYNVLDEGAVGDGSTDDTSAIQTAVDKAANNGGGVVYFPGGNSYRVTSKIVIDGETDIKLSGYGAEIVGLPDHVFNVENSVKIAAEGFRYNPDDSSGTRTQFMAGYNNSDIRLYNINCEGRGALFTSTPSSKITSASDDDSYRVIIRDCTVEYDADTNTIENGINLYNVKNQIITGYFYDQITAQDGDGIKINAPSSDPTEQVDIRDCEILNPKDDCIDFYGSRGAVVRVVDCKLADAGTRGIKGERSNKITVRGTEFDNCDLFIADTADKATVDDCLFRNVSGKRCLSTDAVDHAVVRDTKWTNCTVERPIETDQSSGDQRLVVDSCHFDTDNTDERSVALRCRGGTSEVKLVNNHKVSSNGDAFFRTFDDATLFLWANNNSIENAGTAFQSATESGEYYIHDNRYESVGTQIDLSGLTDETGSN